MHTRISKHILLWLIVAGLSTACTSITNLFPKVPRPFQPREFNSAQWKSGDYQTRGEMVSSKLSEQIYKIKNEDKNEKVLELLGKPDAVTKAVCCYAGRAGRSTEEVEVWIYNIEIEKVAKEGKILTGQALKVYFGSTGVHQQVGDRDGDHAYFPMIGFLGNIEIITNSFEIS